MISAFFSGIAGKVAAVAAAIGAGFVWLFFHDRAVKKEVAEDAELEGRRARDEVEDEHRADTHDERLGRLSDAADRAVLRGGKTDSPTER